MSNELERLSDNLNALNEMHKITVDRKYNSSSENPQSGIAVAEAVESHIFDIDNPHQVTASQVGTYSNDKIDSLLGRGTLNLLDSNNIKKWSVERQSSSSDYSMFAGTVDLTDCELDGITGALSLVQTFATDANYVDFKYSDAFNLGDEFSILLTEFMKTNINKTETNNPTEESFIELDLGDCAIKLVRMPDDASSETAWNRSNFRVAVKFTWWATNDLGYEVRTSSGYIPSADLLAPTITTALYDGNPTTETKLSQGGIANTKIIDNSLSETGMKSGSILAYTNKSGWKDIIVSVKNGYIKIEDCEGNILLSESIPEGVSFRNIEPRVRIYSDSILMREHTSDVFRFEISSNYINKIHEHENKDVLDTITQEVVDVLSQTAVEFGEHKADTSNPHQVTTEQIGTLSKEEIVEKIDKASKGELNLLDSEHIKKWNIVRESDNPETPADTEYNHYAGAVDMTGQGIEGVTGMLAQLATNSFTTNWTDFVYDGTVDLGTNFSVLLTPFIRNYSSNDKLPNNNSYVEVKFGLLSVRLTRKWEDAQSQSGFYKLRVGLYTEGSEYPLTETDVITTCTGDFATYPTTTLSSNITPLMISDSSVMTYIRNQCPAQNGHVYKANGITRFAEQYGWKDITLKVRNGVLSLFDANGNPFKFYSADGTFSLEEFNIFGLGITTDVFYNITPKIRFFHDTSVGLYHPQALMRFEIKVDDGCYCAESLNELENRLDAFEPRVKSLENSVGELNETVTTITSEALPYLGEEIERINTQVGEVNGSVEEATGKSDEAVNMASTALEEVGKVGDFARAFYLASEVLSDALLVYVGTTDNVTHLKSYIVNSSTANVPVADSTFRGVRHPISMLHHSADNIDYIVKITEVKPVFGRQWMRCYSTDTQSWSDWVEA